MDRVTWLGTWSASPGKKSSCLCFLFIFIPVILLDLRCVAKLFLASLGTTLSEVQRAWLFCFALLKSLHPEHLSSMAGSVGASVIVGFVLSSSLSEGKLCCPKIFLKAWPLGQSSNWAAVVYVWCTEEILILSPYRYCNYRLIVAVHLMDHITFAGCLIWLASFPSALTGLKSLILL